MGQKVYVDYVRFFKVPFDNTYKNVYNYLSTDSKEIYNWLESNFRGIRWDIDNSPSGKISFKTTNGKSTLSYTSAPNGPSSIEWFNIKDYNYCAVRFKTSTKEFYMFYFVTGYSTLYQGVYPATNISIEYDVWTNNFTELSAVTDKFTQVQGHILDVQKISNLIYHKYISDSMQELRTIYQRLDFGKKILWLKLKMNSEIGYYIKNNDGAFISTNINSANASCSQMPIVYVPVGVYNSQAQAFDDAEYNLYDKFNNLIVIKKLKFNIAQSGQVASAEFTFYPPFDYSLTAGTTNYTIDSDVIKISEIYVKMTIDGTTVYRTIAGSILMGRYAANQPLYDKKTQVASILTKFTTSSAYGSTTGYNSSLIAINSYPNDYYEVQTGGAKYKIIPPQDAMSARVYVYVIDEYVAFSVAFYKGNSELIYESRRIPLPNCGYLTIVSDSESLFYRNQGNQLIARQQNASTQYQLETVRNYAKLTAGAIGIASGSGAGVATAAGAILSQYGADKSLEMQNNTINSIRADVANYLDSATNINNDALLALCEQNQVIVNHYSPDTTDYAYEKVKLNIHKYGRATNVESSINDLPHKIFNYKRFSDYELPTIYNIDERNKLISILRSGVTIWNVLGAGSENELTAIKTMTKNCNNPCTEVLA